MKQYILVSIASVFVLGMIAGCSGDDNLALPLLTGPVKAAAPTALGGTATRASRLIRRALSDRISASDFADRFFTGGGPTNIYTILATIDSRITEVNSQSGGSQAACVTQAPVAYTITPFGSSVTMYGQCYRMIGSTGFIQWGVRDSVTYLWVQVGAGNLAAIVTPTASGYAVKSWLTVGNAGQFNTNNTTSANWCTIGSYGVMEITADASQTVFEMVAAGTGLGYCGIHLASDGNHIYGEGSADSNTCGANAPICISAADLNQTIDIANCSVGTADFTLTSIGRTAAHCDDTTGMTAPPPGGNFGASPYPNTPNITLNGGTDSLAFGPTVPTAGVGAF